MRVINLLLLSLIICSATSVSAQEVDSLFRKLKVVSGEDRIETLLSISHYHLTNSPDSVDKYAWMAHQEAIGIGNNDLLAKSIWLLGCSQRIIKDYDSAKRCFELATGLSSDTELQANVRMGLGGLAYGLQEFDVALEHFINASKAYETLQKIDRLSAAYGNIGLIMNVTDLDEKAFFYYRRSIDLSRSIGLKGSLLPTLVNISTLFLKNEEYDSAIAYADECYQLSRADNLLFGMGKSVSIIAQALIKKEAYNESIARSKEGQQIFDELGIEQLKFGMQRYEALALFKLGREREALEIALELESKMSGDVEPDLEHIYLLLHDIYEALGDYELALGYHQKFHQRYENFLEKEKEQYLTELETKYAVEKKEQEIASLTQQNAIQELKSGRQNILLVTSVLSAMLIVVLIMLYYQRRLTKQKEQTAIHRQQLLRSQLNPHFIFNSLSSIRGFLFSGGNTAPAIAYLGKFAKLMRMVLDLSSKEWVTLADELAALELYLEIQKIRFKNSFDFKITLGAGLDPDEMKVPPLTAQPFVENAIEHGLKGIDQGGVVEITCANKDRKLVFEIRDNGIGIDHVKPHQKHQSKAIQIFRERLSILSGYMRASLNFNVADLSHQGRERGTLVTYELPLMEV